MITTDRQIQSLKPEASVYWEAVKSPHGGGLAIRVSTGGGRSWYVRYRFNGKQDAMNIGTFPAMGLKEARETHAEVRNLLAQGTNPKRVRRQQKAENQAAWTMQELFQQWIVSYAKAPSTRTKRPPSEKVVEQTAWRWGYYLRDNLGEFLVKGVSVQQVKAIIIEVAENQSREQARKCLTLLKAMFDHAEQRGQIAINPAVGIEPARIGASKGAPRKRYLSLTELRQVWTALDQSGLTDTLKNAIRLLILTGQRRGELLKAKWRDIDLDKAVWRIPATDTKNRQAHTVYLSDAAVALLRTMPNGGEYVFQGRVEGQPIGDSSLTTAVMRLQGRKTRERDESAPLGTMEPFSAHDLRRTFATGLGEYCAVQPHVIERMLNHQPEDALVAVYQHAGYAAEQQAAWQAWGDLIASQVMVEPDNVVAMKFSTTQG
ncbi:tyrosine-type recombinase/integrase [Salinicola sp. NYA28a]